MNTKTEASGQTNQISNDVQTYLIDNYREAVRQGDRSAAKSCLLAARYFSVDDPIVMNEIYLMAKSDRDVNEASKCFASLVKLLLPSDSQRSADSNGTSSQEPLVVTSRIRDEIGLYLSQLKSKSLHLKSKPPASLLSSSRSEDASSTSRSKVPMQLSEFLNHTSAQSRSDIVFYQQLFDNLPSDVNKSIIDHTIESCEDCFEQCRLMLLSMSVFPDSVNTYGNGLLAKLIDIIRRNVSQEEYREYASSLLVLDAIPLVLRSTSISKLNLDIGELFSHILGYYSRHCLKIAAKEYEFNELNEGLKKSIAERILCKESNHPYEDVIEENINSTFDMLFEKYLEESTEKSIRDYLTELKTIIPQGPMIIFEQLERHIDSKFHDVDIPENILLKQTNDQTQTSSFPPKSRGRAKKVLAPDSSIDPKLLAQASLAKVVFFTVVRRLFKSSALYLRQTRSRILIDFDNPFERNDNEVPSNSHPLSRFRDSTISPKAAPTFSKPQVAKLSGGSAVLKKMKIERKQPSKLRSIGQPSEDSPLNSTYSRQMDDRIVANLCVARQCLDLILDRKSLNRLWLDFLKQNSIESCNWFRRIQVDTAIFKRQYSTACEVLESFIGDRDPEERGEESHNVERYSTVRMLRAFAQLICCEIIQRTKEKAFIYVNDLLTELRKNGLTAAKDSYAIGDVMKEYKVIVIQELGFLFFDSLPLVRFCIDALTSILHRAVFEAGPFTDTLIGHTIVLSQFDWPKNAHIYELCIEWIRTTKPKAATPQCLSSATKFTYTEFFQYVKNPTFIEDFMALLNHGYTLDFKDGSPSSSQATTKQSTSRSSANTSTRSGKAITTRGVNKSFKEDLKVALTTQMKNSTSIVPLDLILEFIQAYLLPYLDRTS